MFENIEPKHIDSAVLRVKNVQRGLRSETSTKIADLTVHFHENHNWETVSHRWEQMLLEAVERDMEEKTDEGLAAHESIMSLISIIFCIGFDEGYQAQVDTAVEKLLKE